MRERLIGLLSKFEITCCNTCIGLEKSCHSCHLGQLADYLLADGWTRPPCKAGAVVYVLRSQTSNGKNLYLREERIDHYRVFDKMAFMVFESGRTSVSDYLWETTVFLTREEAEAALVNYESSKNEKGGAE